MLLVMMVTVISFRSFKFGLLALIPMFTGIMLTIIAMNALKIPFDVVTVMFTSVAIGVGIDDSIHLILQYRRQERIVKSEIRTILQRTMRVAGKPILLTSTALVGGLLVLSLSHFLPIAYFGILISMVLASTTLGALVVLPALLAIFFRKTYTP
jgi:predicted RND superfamily exporter protein